MTSISAQNNLPNQASNSISASQPTLSYASTAKKAVSSPPVASGSSTTSPAVAVGGSAPSQHGKSSSVSPVNGRSSVPPAVPTVSAPAIAHGSATNGSSDHSRKASVTINANNAAGYLANGGPVGGSKAGIQFGSLADSPAVSHSTPQITHTTSSAAIAIPGNPRVTSPAQSPSPIPQPSASGGRPPSGLGGQGNNVTFGSLGGDGDRHMRQASGTHGPLAPNSPAGHLRRESSQSIHSDASNQNPGAGRGGFQQGGRGRGGFNNGFQPQQQGFPPNQQYRNNQGPGRGGMGVPFQQQGRPLQYPNSPHQAARSPALTNSIPNTPNMPQAMPMQGQQQFNNHYNPMQGYQVHNPSHLQSYEFRSNPLKGKSKKYRGGSEKYSSSQQRLRGNSREAFSQVPTSHELLPHNFDFQVQADVRVQSVTIPQMRSGPFLPQNGPHAASGSRMPSDGLVLKPNSTTPLSLPPMPPFMSSESKHFDVKKLNFSPESSDFQDFLTSRQGYNHGFPPAFQQNMPMHNANPYMQYPQMGQMSAYPQSPQPNYQQYIPGQYGAQAPPMSRNSSQISEQRPASSMGGPQTPSMTPAVAASHTATKPPATPSAFVRAKKSAAIVIKRPDGEALDIGALTTPVSPAPTQRLQTPPVVASTPTPPPKPSTPQHVRTESAAVSGKSLEQIQKEIREKVAAAAGNKDAATAAKEAAEEAAKAAELKQKEEEKAKADAEAAAEQKAKDDAEAKAAADKAKADEEEEEMERQIREMEEAEAEREKKEAELLAKRAADKAIADKANEAKRLADAAENDKKLREQEREMERLEDEKERKRAEAEAKANGTVEDKKDDKAAPTTPSTLATKLSNTATTGTESGASTPGSDDSMGPPPPKVNIAEKRAKPAALNLTPLNTKPVEAPQPSAALQSLKSARFLTVLNSSIYPEGIASPNPALNNAVTTKGKSFKYDKEFLLQFQKVFIEKPSLEFESQIKNLIGDGDGNTSSRTGSARPSGSMGPRPGSNRNQPGSFAMGSFGAAGAVGKTSAERFAMSSGPASRPPMGNLASFSRPGGAFPGGSNMSRQPSSNNMNNLPQSPRQQSNRQGRGSKRNPGDFQPSNAKQEQQAAKTMPLTAGMELKPIAVTATGWKPRSIVASQSATGIAGPAPSGASNHMEPDMVQRKVKAALNKMTPEKFDKIADQILAIAGQSKDEQDGRTLRQVIQLTFEKATDEAHWASMYAKFCKRMLETMSPDIKDESILDKNGNVVSGGNLFRKYLLNRCQEEFERGWKVDLPEKPEGERGEEKTEEAVMLSDEYYIAAAAKRRGLGLVQFIGELYKLSMLTERIMHECVKKLVDYTGIPDEAEIESLTKLLKTIGGNLDSTEKGKPMMDVYFQRIQSMIDTPDLPSRLRFMLMDIVDLRRARWVSKEANKGPLTLDEVKAEADKVAAQKAAENARGNQRGGGRMQAGRGDGRNFSGGYGNQPPPDYQKNTVGMDDLRRLTNKNAVNRQASQQMSFGPTSMFSSRSNSGRKMGSMRGLGDDSGPSSRTGTPPQQKEKESATSANAFSLLAGLGSGEENPASPPSATTSPVLTKSTPAAEDKAQEKQEE